MCIPLKRVASSIEAAEKHEAEGGGGFNPRIVPTKSAGALAPEVRFLGILFKTRPRFAASSPHPLQHHPFGQAMRAKRDFAGNKQRARITGAED